MKSLRLLFSLLLLVQLADGCRGGHTSANGDFSPVLVQKLRKHGARVLPVEGLPSVRAAWTIQEDENGFECVVRKAGYGEIEALLFRVLGDSGEKQTSSSGARCCLFKAASVGVAVIAGDWTNQTQINCVRAISN